MVKFVASLSDVRIFSPEGLPEGKGLVVDGVSFRRGRRTLGPLSLKVDLGEMVGLFGPNGSGKTSLLRIIAGELKAEAGCIRLAEREITKLKRAHRQGLGIAVCLHERRALRKSRSILEIVAVALNLKPRVLLVDEPFSGLDGPLARRVMVAMLREARAARCGVLIADHDIRAMLEIVDRAYFVYQGQIIEEGTPGDLLRPPDESA